MGSHHWRADLRDLIAATSPPATHATRLSNGPVVAPLLEETSVALADRCGDSISSHRVSCWSTPCCSEVLGLRLVTWMLHALIPFFLDIRLTACRLRLTARKEALLLHKLHMMWDSIAAAHRDTCFDT